MSTFLSSALDFASKLDSATAVTAAWVRDGSFVLRAFVASGSRGILSLEPLQSSWDESIGAFDHADDGEEARDESRLKSEDGARLHILDLGLEAWEGTLVDGAESSGPTQ